MYNQVQHSTTKYTEPMLTISLWTGFENPKPQSFIQFITFISGSQLLVAQHAAQVQECFMWLGKHAYIHIHSHVFTCFHIHSYLCLDFVQNPLRQSRTNSSHTVLLQPCSLRMPQCKWWAAEQTSRICSCCFEDKERSLNAPGRLQDPKLLPHLVWQDWDQHQQISETPTPVQVGWKLHSAKLE